MSSTTYSNCQAANPGALAVLLAINQYLSANSSAARVTDSTVAQMQVGWTCTVGFSTGSGIWITTSNAVGAIAANTGFAVGYQGRATDQITVLSNGEVSYMQAGEATFGVTAMRAYIDFPATPLNASFTVPKLAYRIGSSNGTAACTLKP